MQPARKAAAGSWEGRGAQPGAARERPSGGEGRGWDGRTATVRAKPREERRKQTARDKPRVERQGSWQDAEEPRA